LGGSYAGSSSLVEANTIPASDGIKTQFRAIGWFVNREEIKTQELLLEWDVRVGDNDGYVVM
jgi:hypothetical protein